MPLTYITSDVDDGQSKNFENQMDAMRRSLAIEEINNANAVSGDEAFNTVKPQTSGKPGITRTATLPIGNPSDSRSNLRKTSLATAG